MTIQGLMLDALYPPTTRENVLKDMASVGADAMAVYVLRRNSAGGLAGNGSWSASNVPISNVLPIIVPGNNPRSSDIQTCIQQCFEWGITTRALVIDIEVSSFPSVSWVSEALHELHGFDWKCYGYGDLDTFKSYPTLDGYWISHGLIPVRASSIEPIPVLPEYPLLIADQYAVSVGINRSDYDASVVDMSIFSSVSSSSSFGDGDNMKRVYAFGSIHRLYIDTAGIPRWGAYPEGSGQIYSYTSGLGRLGSPVVSNGNEVFAIPNTLAVCPEPFGTEQRLSCEALWTDGVSRQIVVSAIPNYEIIADWAPIVTLPPEAVTSTVSVYKPHTHSTDTGVPS